MGSDSEEEKESSLYVMNYYGIQRTRSSRCSGGEGREREARKISLGNRHRGFGIAVERRRVGRGVGWNPDRTEAESNSLLADDTMWR